MQYLCVKQLMAGGETYHPGKIIPDGVILPERSGKLIKSGYISVLDGTGHLSGCQDGKLFTKEQVADIVARELAEKMEEALAKMKIEKEDQFVEMQSLDAWDGTVPVPISLKGASNDADGFVVPAKLEDIQQVFSIMQLNAEEGARAITDVKSENVLALLHAADSRKTIKDAAKKQADNLFPAEDVPDEPTGDNTDMGMDTEGADT